MDYPGEKLVIKMWETLTDKGIGLLLTPWQMTREGKARNELRRQEILMLAQAETDAADIRSGRKILRSDGNLLLADSQERSDLERDGRIEPRLALSHAIEFGTRAAAANAARSEINSAKAILFAEEQLSLDSQTPPSNEINEDWLFIWREHAGKVSVEDLQRLWGSVLAGEVKSPGKYSIRTLEFLKTLSKEEGEEISKVARYVINGRIVRSQNEYLESQGITFSLLLRMQELGVVSGVEAIGLQTTFKSALTEKYARALLSHGKALIAEHADPSKELTLDVYMLTEVGIQVLGLGSFSPDIEYIRRVGKGLLQQGFSVKLADWREVSETMGEYDNAEDITSD